MIIIINSVLDVLDDGNSFLGGRGISSDGLESISNVFN
jgi:hypothetical protein